MAKPFVIKIGGAGVDHPFAPSSAALWRALKQAHEVLDGQLILIHGGGRAVDQHLDRLQIKTERREGLRITPPDIMPEITAVLAGRVNKALVAAIQLSGLPAVGVCLGDGLGSIACEKNTDLDLGQVGRITGGTGHLLHTLLNSGYLPVTATIGFDDKGHGLNINADDAAAGIGRIVKARNVILLTDVPGILDAGNKLIPQIDAAGIDRLIASNTISGGMIPKAKAALAAANAAGIPTTIASWNNPEDLIRLARGESVGTLVLPTPVALDSGPTPTIQTPRSSHGPLASDATNPRATTPRLP